MIGDDQHNFTTPGRGLRPSLRNQRSQGAGGASAFLISLHIHSRAKALETECDGWIPDLLYNW